MATDRTAPEPDSSADAGIEAASVLADDLRRGLYRFIRRVHRPVSREEAASEVGISAKLAAFHLDKLVASGLLRFRYESPGGVRKVGRKPKVYEPAETHVRVSIPERRPDVLAEILIDAVLADEPGEDARAAALRAARGRGEALGAGERARRRPGRLGPERSLTLGEAVLEQYGFEPDRRASTEVRLLNCPFHPLAARSPGLVCGINHAFLGGFLDGLGATGVEALLEPRPGQCCVELRAAPSGGSGRSGGRPRNEAPGEAGPGEAAGGGPCAKDDGPSSVDGPNGPNGPNAPDGGDDAAVR